MCCKQSCLSLLKISLCVCVCVCVCAEVTEVYDTMSCLPIVSDRAATEGSKYFELGQQPHEFFLTRNTCSFTADGHFIIAPLTSGYHTV